GGGTALRDAGEDRHSPAADLDREPHYPALLFRLQRTVLTQRAEHDQAAHTGLNEDLEVECCGVRIERLVPPELRCDRGEEAPPVDFHGAVTATPYGQDAWANTSPVLPGFQDAQSGGGALSQRACPSQKVKLPPRACL